MRLFRWGRVVDETLVTHASSQASGIAPIAGGDGNLFVVPGDGDAEHFALLSALHPHEPLRIFALKNDCPGHVLCVAVDGDVIASGDSVGNVCLWSLSTARTAVLAKAEDNHWQRQWRGGPRAPRRYALQRLLSRWRPQSVAVARGSAAYSNRNVCRPARSPRACRGGSCIALGGKPGDEVGIYGGAAGWGAVGIVPLGAKIKEELLSRPNGFRGVANLDFVDNDDDGVPKNSRTVSVAIEGDVIAAASTDGYVRTWSMACSIAAWRDRSTAGWVTLPTRTFKHGGDCVTTVCFHGGLLVSGGHDSRIRVWELNDRGGKMQCTHMERRHCSDAHVAKCMKAQGRGARCLAMLAFGFKARATSAREGLWMRIIGSKKGTVTGVAVLPSGALAAVGHRRGAP